MKTLRLTIQRIFWVMLWILGLGLGQQITWAAEGELEYRFERMVPHQGQSWNFNQPQGVAIAPDGSMWVADLAKHRLHHFHSDGTFIGQFGTYGYLDYPFPGDSSYPIPFALAADGSVWVADSYNNRIQHFTSDGVMIKQFGIQGYGDGQFNNPSAIAVAPDKGIWVADTGNNRLQNFNPDGSYIGQFGSEGLGAGQFEYPRGIAVAADNTVWVANSSSDNLIQHFTTDGIFIGQLITQDGTPSSDPPFIVVAMDGSVWMTDSGNGRIRHFDPDGTVISQFGSVGFGEGQFERLSGIALANDGSVWIADSFLNRLQHFSANGLFLGQLGSGGNGAGQFDHPRDIEVATDDTLWVVDTYNHRLQHLNGSGAFIGQLGSQGDSGGQFSYPSDLAFAADGSLWVADSGNGRTQHLSLDGGFLGQFSVQGLYFLGSPNNLALAPDDSIWVEATSIPTSCCKDSYIHHLNSDGSAITKYFFSGWSRTFGPSYEPNGMTVNTDGSLWLADTGNDRVQHYKPDGTLIGQFGSQGKNSGQFSAPNDIAFTADGSLWIADSGNGRLQHLSAGGDSLGQLGNYGNGAQQFADPSGIALAKDNSLWVVDRGNNRIQKFVPHPKGNTAHPFKAFVLAGSGEKVGSRVNENWAGTWQVAQKANKALQFQGFNSHEEILFLTAGNTQFDLDANGQMDDLQAATKDGLRLAITDWAKDSNDLVVYLAGFGTSNKFQINSTETLSGEELAAWLTELEKNLPGKVTVVIESDNAGSFLNALANKNRPRIVIASSSANQPVLMADHGVNSFSYSFWSQVMDGASLQTAFFAAQNAISPFMANNQPLQAQGDANGDAQSNLQDLAAIGDYCLGMCTKTITTAPVINLPGQPRLTLNAASTLDFNVTVQPAANTNLLEVWALIQPPAVLNAPTNALNLIKIPLSCDTRQQSTGRYQHFDNPGQYRVHFYALDTHYKLSDPVFLDITIQAQNPGAMPAEYDDQQGLITLHDVDVNGQHYQAALQYQNGLYRLLALGLTPSLFSPAASFDRAANLLTIPLARAFGQDYQGSFKLVDNYLFQLLSATPR
ncbi:MAG: hypothetical protein ABL903_10845 [Methylococcales bacterium]